MPNRCEVPAGTGDQVTSLMRKTLDAMTWKVGVMFADARDAKRDRLKRLVELLGTSPALTRAGNALQKAISYRNHFGM